LQPVGQIYKRRLHESDLPTTLFTLTIPHRATRGS